MRQLFTFAALLVALITTPNHRTLGGALTLEKAFEHFSEEIPRTRMNLFLERAPEITSIED